ncbi:MAG TPA: carboxypeptidase-like regulatory domain-containing protein, partial [Candidatus Acidoferrum sp.]|nr:carboxypeptidase-like regulatory domain-containing protein [Candidatus Acidoferrum sp.]
MRRNLFARISIIGILIQLAICTPAVAANVKAGTEAKYRITGVVKDALGRPLKLAALTIQGSDGRVVAHASSNDAGEFSFDAVGRGTYAVVTTKDGFKTATAIVTVGAKGAA